MSSIDERIVDLKFNNSQFEQKIKTTLTALDSLKRGLNLQAATKGVQELHAAGNRFNMSGMASGVAGMGAKLTMMGVVGVTALANIASRAVDAGITLVKSLTIDPIKTGLDEYETQLNAVQTILANTQSKGGNLKTVNAALQELNNYSDKTIYNFSEMARNIGTFTAAGVGLKTSTEAIKGIANLAAMSGSNAQQASTAMYQLSQALSTGTVKLQDWNSVVNAGMGGEVFQEALKSTARNHGIAVDDIIKKQGSFRNSLQKGWLTSKILTETLSKFTGDLSAQQLKSMGYNDKEITKIMKQAKTAQDAATKVKTMTQLIGTLKESAQSGWSQTWQIIFGDFEEAKKLFTNINNVLGKMITDSSDARNKLLKGWDKAGGRDLLVKALGVAFKNLMKIVKPLGEAIEQIFPPVTVTQLVNFTNKFYEFTKRLKLGDVDLFNLTQTFKGVLAIFSIGWQVIKGLGAMLGDLFNRFAQNHSGLLEFTASIGEWLVNLDWALKKGDDLSSFFGDLGNVIATVINVFKSLGQFIGAAFDGFDQSEIKNFMTGMSSSIAPLAGMSEGVTKAWNAMSNAFSKVWAFMQPVVNALGAAFAWVGDKIKDALGQMSLGNLAQIGGLGLLTAIGLSIRGFFSNLTKLAGEGPNIVKSITGVFDAIKERINPSIDGVDPDKMFKIAGAIALLALSLVALSMVDAEGLVRGMIAMGALFKMMQVAMGAFEAMAATAKPIKMAMFAGSLMLISIAVSLLAIAVSNLAKNDMKGIAKGLIGVGGILGALVLFMNNVDFDKGAFENAGALIVLAIAINLLAGAVKIFATMSWEELAKGGTALAGVLAIIAGALQIMPKDIPQIAGALLGVAVSMAILSGVFKVFASMSWEDIGKAGTVLAGALFTISAALWAMPKDMLAIAVSLILVSVAMAILSGVFKVFASMSWEDIAKAGVVLAGSLALIAGGLYLMTAALPGAAALVIAAAALMMIAPAMLLLGSMSWDQIGAGLAMLASTLGILAVGGLLMIVALPGFLGLGAAILLIGAGTLMAGQGLISFAEGLLLLAAAGAAGSAAIVVMATTMVGLIPMILIAIGQGLIGIVNVIAQNGAAFMAAGVTLIMALLGAIKVVIPEIIDVMLMLIDKLLVALMISVPTFTKMGMKIIVGFLKGVADDIDKVVEEGLRIVKGFLKGIAKGLPGVTEEAANLIITFVNSLADTIQKKSAEMGTAGGKLAAAIIEGMAKGLINGIGSIVEAAKRVAGNLIQTVKNVLGIHSPSKVMEELGKFAGQGFYNGLLGMEEPILSRVTSIINEMKDRLKSAIEETDKEVKDLEAKLKKQLKAKKKTTKTKAEIAQTRKDLAEAKDAQKREQAAQNYLLNNIKDEQNKLELLSSEYDLVTSKMDNASQALANLQQQQIDAAKNIANQFAALPEFASEGDLVNQYLDSMKTQIEATKKFAADLADLRKAGLDDTTYEKLLAKGVAAQPFISALIESGQIGIDEINRLDKEVTGAANALGTTASNELYNAGIEAAKGLLKGLTDQRDAISAEMTYIANAMVKSIKDALGIKSPSREFAKIGGYSVSGLMDGMQKMIPALSKSSSDLGDTALSAIKNSMSNVADALGSDMDMSPTIRPVLDLSAIKKDATLLDGLLKPKELGVTTSYDRATAIATANEANQDSSEKALVDVGVGTTVNFVQNNNSPKALSNGEIYRQTRNGLSVAKEGLRK